MRRRVLLIAALLAAAPGSGAPQEEALLPLATDLQQLGEQSRRTRLPIVLLFSTPGCPYCREVRRNYLAPLLVADTPAVPAPLIREIVITGRDAMVDFEGRATTHAQFAERQGIAMVPVVMAVDSGGRGIGEPLIGLDASGFYNAYLESLLALARAQAGESR